MKQPKLFRSVVLKERDGIIAGGPLFPRLHEKPALHTLCPRRRHVELAAILSPPKLSFQILQIPLGRRLACSHASSVSPPPPSIIRFLSPVRPRSSEPRTRSLARSPLDAIPPSRRSRREDVDAGPAARCAAPLFADTCPRRSASSPDSGGVPERRRSRDTNIRSPTRRGTASTFLRVCLALALLDGLLAAAAPAQSPWNQQEGVELHGFEPPSESTRPRPPPHSEQPVARPKTTVTRKPPPKPDPPNLDLPEPFHALGSVAKPRPQEKNAVITLSTDALRPFLHFTRGVRVERGETSRDEIFHEDGSFDYVLVDAAGSTSVTLRCSAGPYPSREADRDALHKEAMAPTVHWIKDGVPLEDTSAELLLRNASTAEVGEYRCAATAPQVDSAGDVVPGGVLVSDALFLRLEEPPSFSEEPRSQAVAEGRSVRLECRAEGAPLPKLRWLRDDQPLDEKLFDGRLQIASISGESVLHLRNASREDEGRFSCVAESKEFSRQATSSPAVLQVLESPSDSSLDRLSLISPDSATVEVRRGRSAILECLTPDSTVSVFWRRVGQKTVLSKTSMLLVKGQQMDGAYECVAMPGSHILRSVTVHAIERPLILSNKASPEMKVASQGSVERFECSGFSEGPLDEQQGESGDEGRQPGLRRSPLVPPGTPRGAGPALLHPAADGRVREEPLRRGAHLHEPAGGDGPATQQRGPLPVRDAGRRRPEHLCFRAGSPLGGEREDREPDCGGGPPPDEAPAPLEAAAVAGPRPGAVHDVPLLVLLDGRRQGQQDPAGRGHHLHRRGLLRGRVLSPGVPSPAAPELHHPDVHDGGQPPQPPLRRDLHRLLRRPRPLRPEAPHSRLWRRDDDHLDTTVGREPQRHPPGVQRGVHGALRERASLAEADADDGPRQLDELRAKRPPS
uniref:Neogenin n=1 Tax=Steinernema glaseri TaxID=37863 RepID=A0A1I7YIY9_9BILA